MKILDTHISGLKVVEMDRFEDSRGSFMEIFRDSGSDAQHKSFFQPHQINLSISVKGAVRGLHYSLAPNGQDKLISVAYGKILDTIIDIRSNSPTFREIYQIELSDSTNNCVLISSGLAHGFSVKSNTASVVYLMSSEYNPSLERSIYPMDSSLKIDWGVSMPIISEKDSQAPLLEELKSKNEIPLYRKAKDV